MGRKRSYAAYTAGDTEDAKRGTPAVSLEPWAGARGLEYLGSALPGAFSNVMPVWAEYVANLARGPLAPDRFGYVAHEQEEIGLDDDGDPRRPGPFHQVRVHSKGRGMLRFMANLDERRPNEPFAANALWVPTTQAAVRVPEAAVLGPVTIRPASRFPAVGNPGLDDAGLPGFRIAGTERGDDERLALGGAARALLDVPSEEVALRVDRGIVAVRANGFVTDEARLDALCAVAVRIGAAMAELTRPRLAPQPFDVALPPPAPASWPPGIAAPQPFEVEAFRRVSGELAMAEEDPLAYHCAQPRCPVPGRALGLVRGVLPGTTATGRLGFFAQGAHTGGTYRTAVMVAARPDAATPLGGTLHQGSDLFVEVAGGVAHAWPRNRSRGALEAAETVARAVPTLRALGLADV